MAKKNTGTPLKTVTANASPAQPQPWLTNHTAYLLAFLAQFIVAFIYYLPTLSGKTIGAHDYLQGIASSHELVKYYQETGHYANWASSMFSGMPAYQVWKGYDNIAAWMLDALHKIPSVYIYISVLIIVSASALFYAMRVHPIIMFIGGSGLLLSNFTIVSLFAGHNNKVMVIALVPATIAGVWLLFEKKKYLSGIAITALSIAFQIRSNHIQITYFMMFLIGIWTISNLYLSFVHKNFKHAALSLTGLILSVSIGVLTNTTQLLTTQEYSKETQRGGASPVDAAKSTSEEPTDGVGYSYATSWSYGKLETLTLLIPNFAGGASQSKLDENSNVYKTLIKNGVPANQATQFSSAMPTYWGPQPFTAGTTYIGAVLIFLMVMGFYMMKSPVKWWLMGTLAITFFIAWGDNFSTFYKLLFNYLPFFNKFRTPSMIFYLSTIITVMSAALGLQYLINHSDKREEIWKPFLKVAVGAAAVMLFFSILAPYLLSFESAIDQGFIAQLQQATGNNNFANAIYQALLDDRRVMMRADSIRSTIFIALTILLIVLFIKRKLQATGLLAGIAVLIVIDLWGIDARYVNHDSFKDNIATGIAGPQLRESDKLILQDNDISYRVLDLTVNSFSEAAPSFYHKNIGGYHSAKLNRYQDIISYQINDNLKLLSQGQPEKANVLNMLNTKYFITSEAATGVIVNPAHYGNAWFVSNIKIKNGPVEVFDHLMEEDLRETALLEKKTDKITADKNFIKDSSDYIRLDKFDNDIMEYSYSAKSDAYAVFSEIYYNEQKGWNAYLDGQKVPHEQVNYVLRGLQLPAGQHKVVFKMEPRSVAIGNKADLAGSALIFLFIISALIKAILDKRKTAAEQSQ